MNNNKGFLASICSFFSGLFSANVDANNDTVTVTADPNNNNDGLTGVERYIRNQANSVAPTLTSVELYIRRQNAAQLTGVEQYIRNNS